MKEIVKIFALGGLDENGKNLYVVDVNDDLYIFDAGIRYPEESLLGIDIILPGINFLFENRRRIKGFFLTHGHDENMGAIPFLCEEIDDVPIYATKTTIAFVKDAANRYKKVIKNSQFVEIIPGNDFVVANRNIYTYEVTHGSGDAVAYALETNYGLVVYSGEYIVEYAGEYPYRFDFRKLIELSKKNVLCLLSESYNASYKGHVSPNYKLLNKILQISDDVKGRMIVSLYGQNMYGLKEVLTCAYRTHRKIYLYGEYSNYILDLLKALNYGDQIKKLKFTNNIFEKNCLILVCELGGKVFDLLSKISEIDNGENELKLNEDDAFIIASPAHTGTEVSFAKILDKLHRTGAMVYNISNKEVLSMHAGSEDLKLLLSVLKPKYYMPVRGYYMRLIDNAKLALELNYNHNNILVYDNGMVANFENGEFVPSFENVECNEIMVDGIGIGDVGNVVINDRRKLSHDGVMIVGISFSMQTRQIVAGPDVQMRGLIFLKDADYIIKIVGEAFEKIVYDFVQTPGIVDFNDLRMICKEQITKLVKAELGKEPMVLPVIISV